jgi:hypothetical protein
MPYLTTSAIADKGVFLDAEVKRILHAAVLEKNERTERRKKERVVEQETFRGELIKARDEIKERRHALKESQEAAAAAREAAQAEAWEAAKAGIPMPDLGNMSEEMLGKSLSSCPADSDR